MIQPPATSRSYGSKAKKATVVTVVALVLATLAAPSASADLSPRDPNDVTSGSTFGESPPRSTVQPVATEWACPSSSGGAFHAGSVPGSTSGMTRLVRSLLTISSPSTSSGTGARDVVSSVSRTGESFIAAKWTSSGATCTARLDAPEVCGGTRCVGGWEPSFEVLGGTSPRTSVGFHTPSPLGLTSDSTTTTLTRSTDEGGIGTPSGEGC
jgi:hypothetical protein